jgi:predicted nucleotidyltransferase
MNENREIDLLKEVLRKLRAEEKVLIAILYGSYAKGTSHRRSDIDLALYIKARDENEEIEIIDKILMTLKRDISILRLDDEDESPFVVQEALKGIHLVEPDEEILYEVGHRTLHECEGIRFRRELSIG